MIIGALDNPSLGFQPYYFIRLTCVQMYAFIQLHSFNYVSYSYRL